MRFLALMHRLATLVSTMGTLVCVNNRREKEKSLTKEEEREGKGRKLKPKERVLYNCLPILYGRRDKGASS